MEMITAAMLLGMAVPQTDTAIGLTLPLAGDVEQKRVVYQCEGAEAEVPVLYVNAAPNYLAVVPVGGARLVFVGVIAGSGVRYVSGAFEWWNKGTEAFFRDLRHEEEEPVTCTEKNETP
jgi:membrane-bound inhibitor of C-type lysozyme